MAHAPAQQGNHNSLRLLLVTNMLYSFIAAALAVMVPLYLIDRKVDLAGIGLILAIGPLVFMLLRVTLASIADSIGTRAISLLYSVSNLLSVILYIVSGSVAGFAAAVFGESIRASAFWAITRTEIISEARSGGVLAYFVGMRQLADALGRLAIGFLLAWFAFNSSFTIMAVLSLLLVALVLTEKGGVAERPKLDAGVVRRIFKERPPTFWHASLLLTLFYLPMNMLLGFVLPVYAHAGLGMGYEETGSLVAIFSLVTAIAIVLPARWRFSINLLFVLSALTIPALLLMPFLGNNIILLVLVVALSIGCGNIIGEYIVADQVFRSKDVSTDVGMIFVPLKLAEVLFLASAGFIISQWGYLPVFAIMAACMLLFVVLGRAIMRIPR